MPEKFSLPLDTGRMLNEHKTLRRRPERLLTVLFMFNKLRVSRGWKTFAPGLIFMIVYEERNTPQITSWEFSE